MSNLLPNVLRAFPPIPGEGCWIGPSILGLEGEYGITPPLAHYGGTARSLYRPGACSPTLNLSTPSAHIFRISHQRNDQWKERIEKSDERIDEFLSSPCDNVVSISPRL